MMWTDFYLKAANQTEFEAALAPHLGNPNITLDVVGIMFSRGTLDENGNVLVAPAPLPGYCANLRMPAGEVLPASLVPLQIPAPNYPKRVFLA